MRLTAVSVISALCAWAADPPGVYLWPDGAPGSEDKTGQERFQVQPAGDHVISNVHKPSITVYLLSKETATGAGVVTPPAENPLTPIRARSTPHSDDLLFTSLIARCVSVSEMPSMV